MANQPVAPVMPLDPEPVADAADVRAWFNDRDP